MSEGPEGGTGGWCPVEANKFHNVPSMVWRSRGHMIGIKAQCVSCRMRFMTVMARCQGAASYLGAHWPASLEAQRKASEVSASSVTFRESRRQSQVEL